jgi:hypothetical protein
MRTSARRQKRPPQASSTNFTKLNAQAPDVCGPSRQILDLQRTVGNQAVLHLLQRQQDSLALRSAQPPFLIQPKLALNASGDIYEQEAERVSEQVMRMPELHPPHACASGGVCPRCQAASSHPASMLDSEHTAATPHVHEALASTGHPLDEATRRFFEPRFGHDFSNVRVHVSSVAEQSANGLQARAYTAGQNIVFSAGQFAPKTQEGRRLLAHELTHVVQQSGLHSSAPGLAHYIHRSPLPVGEGATQDDACSGYERDPVSLSIETAKHFLDEVEPGGSGLVTTTNCKANENDPDRIECDVTFEGGQVIQVSIESKLHNVEGQRRTANGRQWCVYHFTCDSNGVLQWQKKGCSADLNNKPSAPSGPDLVG